MTFLKSQFLHKTNNPCAIFEVVEAILLYFTFADDTYIVPCFLGFHNNKEFPSLIQKRAIDLQFNGQDAQSESQKVLKLVPLLACNRIPTPCLPLICILYHPQCCFHVRFLGFCINYLKLSQHNRYIILSLLSIIIFQLVSFNTQDYQSKDNASISS